MDGALEEEFEDALSPEKTPPDLEAGDPCGSKLKICPKCDRVKPDRAHHCSVCRRCVLKMDHHCPWVNNCYAVRK